MQADFRPPKRRTRVREQYEGPLPVSQTPEDSVQFRAEIINQHVLVWDPEHIDRIHSQGYFGKGILSRARPDHSISDQWQHHEGLFLPVVTQSRYDELLRWAGASLSAQGLDEQAVGQTLLTLSQPLEMEDVRKEVEGDDPGRGGGVSPPDADPEQNSCSESDVNAHQDPDPISDQDSEAVPGPDQGHSVPAQGFVLVVPDSEACDDTLVVRRTPVSLTEFLQLSLEEAFFLVYSLGCLSVYLHQEPLSVIRLWEEFCSLRHDFVTSFAAYHHFRSRGWIPKGGSGAKYGVDFMLYRKGPPFYHASYSVVVERADDAFRGTGLRRFSWRSLSALSRITANVSKELMMCYIIYPADLSQAELDSPVCLSKLKVQEVIVSRWVSSRERAEQDDI
ncbi:tRNA-splicing endonuclease subunit Sen2 [Antennarius striatus]|uniref:tRNA-splicing endonuclease subunit Sen2 n=1 Tax=Antennarius striatus TaxID=241820 RepID=UPI0035B14EB1